LWSLLLQINGHIIYKRSAESNFNSTKGKKMMGVVIAKCATPKITLPWVAAGFACAVMLALSEQGIIAHSSWAYHIVFCVDFRRI
jgi:hypothetical protein